MTTSQGLGSALSGSPDRRQWLAAILLFVSLLVTGFAYAPGKGGSLHFDDPHNLGGLSNVVDVTSALDYVSSGDSGPTGRPLALASFAAQAYAWPTAPAVFLHTNICLHLLNGALVVWLVYLLCLARREEESQATWVAAASGAIWMLLPILASSSLFIVQRMTVLSTTLLLAGFIAYLYGRRAIVRRPYFALALMSSSIAAGAGLAALAKENGALLPVLVLVAEWTLLQPPAGGSPRKAWRVWSAVFLVAPAIVLLGYLALRARYSDALVLMRGFSGSERLLTEANILWAYLFRAFLPAVPSLGPFHDDQVIYRNWLDPLPMLAVVGWLAAIAAAIMFRKRSPWLSFAVAWYLVGHALESTTIGLELYFEHRNYLPLIGPVIALVAVTWNVAPQWRTLARAALAAYAVLLSLMLFNTTSLWGHPPMAAEMWARYHPDSLRATMYLSGELQKEGFLQAARKIMTSYADRHPTSGSARLQVLDLSCGIEPDVAQPEQIELLKRTLPDAVFEYGAFDTLERMHQHANGGACDAVLTPETVYDLASIVEANPVFRQHGLLRHNLHVLMAEQAFAQHNLDLTMSHLESALDAYYTVTTLAFAVETLQSAGLQSEAAALLRSAYSHVPANSLQATVFRQQVAALESATLSTEAGSHHE